MESLHLGRLISFFHLNESWFFRSFEENSFPPQFRHFCVQRFAFPSPDRRLEQEITGNANGLG